MGFFTTSPRTRFCAILILTTFLSATLFAAPKAAREMDLLIGTSGTLVEVGANTEKAALHTLQAFIKEETGMNNTILPQKSWRELAQKMTKGMLQIGVFQGHEFAWAQEKYSDIMPLALAVNRYRYPVISIVTKKDNPVMGFAGLKGQSLSLPAGESAIHLFVEHQSKICGKDTKSFFSKITAPKNVEDALDDVVDGVVAAAVVDAAALQAYKRRKPGRFNQLKEIAHSDPLPPPVIACFDSSLPESTRVKFRKSLLHSGRKDRGKMMLTLFHLTGFDPVPADFDKVLARTRKTFPTPEEPTLVKTKK